VHSSISNSEAASHSEASVAVSPPPSRTADIYLRWSIRAAVCLAVFCAALEGITRFGFSHISRIEARIASEHKAALAIRRSSRPTVLLVGNSLMLEGIDYSRLREELAPGAFVVRFPIEQTQYLDWYYGLRRLFSEGSQPDMVVLCMSAEHLITSRIRGDYSAYYLFRLADIPQIRREIDYDLTKTSSLVLARFSLFYAGRSPLRNFVLVRTDPSYAAMLQRLAAPQAHFPPDREMERIAETRLTDLRTLCAAHDAQFAFLLAPGFGPGEAQLVLAGTRSQTDVMNPVHLNDWGRDRFRDGFHLNADGARSFTDLVAPLLKQRLSQH
jgi:hypothetical protein